MPKTTIGVVIADTYPDKQVARFAIERTLREFSVRECLLLSDSCFVDGARHVAIDPLSNLSNYNELILDRLAVWARCDAYLIVQWDGFVLDGQRWRADFLSYDYIGAPWLHLGGAVGAGGFSLRSRRLIEALQRLRQQELERDIDTAEDLQICLKYRAVLEARALRIAGTELASAFAFERPLAASHSFSPVLLRSFGFHGVFNFPLVLAEEQILELFDSMLPRMSLTWAVWFLFVWHAWERRYKDLAARALAALAARNVKLWGQVVHDCLQRGMSAGWIKESQ
jgi:hypothetical protein